MRFYIGLFFIILVDVICLVSYILFMYVVMYNLVEFRFLVIVNVKEGLGLWDVRKLKRLICNLKKRKI